MQNNNRLAGVVGAAITPVKPDFTPDVNRLLAHCTHLLAQGCAYTSVFGTTGEGASFSSSQKISALRQMADLGMVMSRQIPGIMESSIDAAAEQYRAAADLGARAALIIPPFYYTPSDADAVGDFYAAVVARAGSPDLDIVLYNFPVFSGVSFTPDLVRRVIARLDGRVVGIKDSTGDLEGGLALIAAFPELSVFTGDDRLVMRMVSAGGAGMIGGMVNLFPAECVALVTGQASQEAQNLAASRIATVNDTGGLPAIKAVLGQRHNDPAFTRTCPPLRGLTSEASAAVVQALGLEMMPTAS
ncbi:dihydrodipicolinate synthase family protein [Roseinatronobacter alkalisoli]|uniref:Dihydrodipicolinate synthase family protein n=1 Tax=Roseinatronobacter alkalisoli TaxID=3028235 RepID=A0ABT5T8K5_9RHOB|nr:dihydrodipicolinate synthase family protein [Roseinatronobacter sp. HJB301]MDD7970263.1 dihydrodipicolinate synthase family protein [Roseinatronobacter sp. HJB301]